MAGIICPFCDGMVDDVDIDVVDKTDESDFCREWNADKSGGFVAILATFMFAQHRQQKMRCGIFKRYWFLKKMQTEHDGGDYAFIPF